MNPLSDASTGELVEKAQQGECSALDRLLVRFQGRLLDRIRLMMGEEARRVADSGDFVQGVMVEAIRDFGRARIRDDRHFVRWITEVARNNIRDAVRKRRERAFADLSSSVVSANLAAEAQSAPSVAIRGVEEQHDLADAIESLPDDFRTVIELRNFDGLPFKEVGRRMGRSSNAVQLLHTRAMIRLGMALEE